MDRVVNAATDERRYAARGSVLAESRIRLVKPGQYMDKWRLDGDGIRPEANEAVKRTLGFAETSTVPR